jgi:serine/threonine protein kinase
MPQCEATTMREQERHQRITDVFAETVQRPETERDAYLADVCRGDAELEEEVRSLLRHDRPDDELTAIAARAPVPEADRVGQVVGRFRIVGALGQGGMGVVWKAEDPALAREVAIKFLPAAQLDSELARRRFIREARSASVLAHPGVATVYDVGEADGVPYIAMQFVDGRSVRDLAKERRFTPAEAVRIAIRVADVLLHAHQHGVIHRDVTGSNIMIQPDGTPVVLDFGVARRAADTSRLSKTGDMVGTVGYMAPEIIKGEDATPQCDIFSLGVVLYEMLAGRRPFENKRMERVIHATLTLDPELPGRFVTGIPRELDRIVAKALKRSPAERYRDARAMKDDLEALLAGGKLPQPGTTGRKRRFGFR